MQNQELIKRIEADGVKFLSLQFTDLLGTMKSVDIPAHRVPNALEQGVWFDGSSVEGFALEVTGDPEKLDEFIAVMRSYGDIDVTRSGAVAMSLEQKKAPCTPSSRCRERSAISSFRKATLSHNTRSCSRGSKTRIP